MAECLWPGWPMKVVSAKNSEFMQIMKQNIHTYTSKLFNNSSDVPHEPTEFRLEVSASRTVVQSVNHGNC